MARASSFALASALACAGVLAWPACGRGGGHDDGDRHAGAPGQAARDATPSQAPPSPAATDAPSRVTPPAIADLPAPRVRWQVRLPDTPGLGVLQSVGGPAVAAERAVVSSSAIGFAAVDVATGAVVWRRDAETAPFAPAIAETRALLPGRCAHRDDAPARAIACVESVSLDTGDDARVTWLIAPTGVSRAATRWLGWVGDRTAWAAGADVLVFAATGSVDVRLRGPTADELGVRGVAIDGSRAAVSDRDGVSLYAVPEGDLVWRAAFEPAAATVSPPLIAGPVVAVVRDDVLEVRALVDGGLRRAVDDVATSTGALALRGGELHALGIAPAGIAPVRAPRGDGPVSRAPRHVGATGHVLTATWSDRGTAVVAVVRLDSSLRHDAVIAFDSAGVPVWAWPIPEPPEPRTDPIGVAVTAGVVLVFREGRYLAALDL